MNLEIKFPVHEIWGDAFKPYPAQKYPGQNGRAPEIITYFQLPRSVELFQPPERTWTDRDLSMWCGLTSSSWAGACRHWTLSIRSTPRAMFSRHVHYLVSLTRKYGVHNQLGSPKYSNRYLVCTCHVPDTGYFVSFCCCDKHHDQEQLGGGSYLAYTSRPQCTIERSQGRNWTWELGLLTLNSCSALSTLSGHILLQDRTAAQEIMSFTVAWAFLYQWKQSKQFFTIRSIDQPDKNHLLIWGVQDTLGCVSAK